MRHPVPIRFDAPSHHLLVIGDQEIYGGQTAHVEAREALELATAAYCNVTILDEDALEAALRDEQTASDARAKELRSLTRKQLDQLAGGLGITGRLPNKDAVIAAIREAEAEADATHQPEAESHALSDGEGQDPNGGNR